jgi:hypothetical protein
VFADSLKVLFLGNSITHANPDPGVGWAGSWGMAASEESKDYVHRLMTSLGTIPGIAPTEMDTNRGPTVIRIFPWRQAAHRSSP